MPLPHGCLCQCTQDASGPVQVVPCISISQDETWGDKETGGEQGTTLSTCKDAEKPRKAIGQQGDTT